ncbi:hypothetical protein LTR78_006191 [Recurvomyces mirabilis]|uniref:Tryptophan synthase beta chain-like PALP domain-containing protein n=1 Tax=Recurvomyces mirabilis TaxID=574656 RepID=A0AAE1C0J6_9PEZI|nr:hypothetical protein LTR78_006191 [Recurvomyces mirabilis]KAK5152032.1 hypothetical protein LTS14_008806 [Recurvomyces mirabilis]
MISTPTLNIQAIRQAHSIIRESAYRTPVLVCPALPKAVSTALTAHDDEPSKQAPIEIYLKCENFQRAGSFKFRGAYHFLSQLSDVSLCAGVVSYSTGNHATALTVAATILSKTKNFPIPVTIVMTWTASPVKIDTIRRLGGTVIQHGPTLVECMQIAEAFQLETGATLLPQGHPWIATGQGTVMLEFQEQMKELGCGGIDVVIVPSAGGGLLAGTAVVCHDSGSNIRVFGTEPSTGGANLALARLSGEQVTSITGTTIADGLRLTTAACNWQYVKDPAFVQGVFQVHDWQIRHALACLVEELKFMAEPSSAVPLAALLFNEDLQDALRSMNRGMPIKVGLVLTGGNISLDALRALLEGGEG